MRPCNEVQRIQHLQLEDCISNPSSVTCHLCGIGHIIPLTFLSFSLFIKWKSQFLLFTSSQGCGETQRWGGTQENFHSQNSFTGLLLNSSQCLQLSLHIPQQAQQLNSTAHPCVILSSQEGNTQACHGITTYLYSLMIPDE